MHSLQLRFWDWEVGIGSGDLGVGLDALHDDVIPKANTRYIDP
jgi:hypothetical protein